MDLSDYLIRLLAPYEPGAELLPGVRWVGASSEVGLRLRFETDGHPLTVEVAPLEDQPRHAARSERLAFGYRTEGGRQAFDPAFGQRICERVASLARDNEGGVLDAVARDAERTGEHEGRARIRHVRVRSLLEPASAGDTPYYMLSPYVGCVIGCRFCYAQSKVATLRRLAGLPEVPWGSYVDVRVNAPDVLADELAGLEPRPLKFCPIVSDPYQALERREVVTRGCLETIRDAASVWPALVLTRSDLVLRDAELIASLPLAYVGVSLPTVDDEVRRHFEPRAASIDQRLRVLEALRDAGVPTFAMVQPILPGSLDALADAIAEHASSASIDVLRGEEGATGDFADERYSHSRDDTWQREQSAVIADMLRRRSVAVWAGELPPDLQRDETGRWSRTRHSG